MSNTDVSSGLLCSLFTTRESWQQFSCVHVSNKKVFTVVWSHDKLDGPQLTHRAGQKWHLNENSWLTLYYVTLKIYSLEQK